MTSKKVVQSIYLLAFLLCVTLIQAQTIYNVLDYGADPNGQNLSTSEIQSAINDANRAGTGEVYFPSGTYKVTHLDLKSDVTLHIPGGAQLLASDNADDYSRESPVISASGSSNMTIKGSGEINANGRVWHKPGGSYVGGDRPRNILRFTDCSYVTVEDITLKETVSWTCVFDKTDYVTVSGITIRNPGSKKAQGSDGIDVKSSQHVLIENSDIMTGDDAIVLKNSGSRDVFDVLVRNCILSTTCNATKVGTETKGDVYDVTFDGITVNKHPDPGPNEPVRESADCIAAISIQSNDGGHTRNIVCKNYRINRCDTPILILLQDRNGLGAVSNITVENIFCAYSQRASQINVCEGARVQDITMKDLLIYNTETYDGTESPIRPTGGYPDAQKYGRMPAFGLFARDVEGLTLEGTISFVDSGGSGREMVVRENVDGFDDSGVTGGTYIGEEPLSVGRVSVPHQDKPQFMLIRAGSAGMSRLMDAVYGSGAEFTIYNLTGKQTGRKDLIRHGQMMRVPAAAYVARF